LKRKALLGLLISAVALYLALRNVDWEAVQTALRGAHYIYIIPNGLAILLSMWMRAVRWRYMTRAIKSDIGLHSLFASTMIGFMVNNVLPLRLGEIARPFSLSQKEGISRSAAFATIVIERVFDALSLLLFSGLLLAFTPMIIADNPALARVAYVALGVNAAALGFLVMLKLRTHWARRLVERFTSFLPDRYQERVLHVVDRFVDGLGVFEDWRSLAAIMLWSLAIWIVVGGSNYFIFLAFDLSVPWFAPFVVLVIVSLGVMLPAAPGFVGTFQFFTIQALRLFGIPTAIGLSFSLVLHLGNYLPVTLVGLYYLRREHFTLKQIEEEAA